MFAKTEIFFGPCTSQNFDNSRYWSFKIPTFKISDGLSVEILTFENLTFNVREVVVKCSFCKTCESCVFV